MITIELTTEKLEHLMEGAEQYGRCSLLLESTEGDDIALVASGVPRRTRRPPRAQRGNQMDPGLGDAAAQGASK